MHPIRFAFGLGMALGAMGCTPRPPESGARSDGGPAAATSGAMDPLPRVELVRAGKPVVLDAAATRVLVQRVEKALGICNFRSGVHPVPFGDADLSALWTKREAASHLRLRYASDKTIDAIAGKLVFREVLLSVDGAYGPEPALAKGTGGVYGLKKCGYDDRTLGCSPELAPYFTPPTVCPPGL